MSADELMEVERAGWEALSTDGRTAAEHYQEVLGDEILMLFPGGMVIDDREVAIASMSGEPWSSFTLSDERVVPLGEEAAVVAYRATAVRAGAEYSALITSTYVRQAGRWRLVLHQQTPV